MIKVQLVCVDDRHQYVCFQPCPACEMDCDKNKLRPATDDELRLFEHGKDDPGFRGIVNTGE